MFSLHSCLRIFHFPANSPTQKVNSLTLKELNHKKHPSTPSQLSPNSPTTIPLVTTKFHAAKRRDFFYTAKLLGEKFEGYLIEQMFLIVMI